MAEEDGGQEVRRPETPRPKKTQTPAVGRIVLVKMNDGSDRPMMVVKVWDVATVNGIIFLDGWNDRGLAAPGTREGSLMSWATSVKRGTGAKEWRFYDD